MMMVEESLKYQVKICENGISNIFVLGNIMVMKDCEHNFYAYDIIKAPDTDMRTLTSNYAQEISKREVIE